MQGIMNDNSSLTKQFIKFLLPSVSAMWFFSIYTMVDGIFVGKGVGPTALAAVNISMPYINAIFSLALLISVGASTLIAFHLGEGNQHLGNQLFTLNTVVLTIIGIIITVLSLFFLEPISIFLGATPETLTYVKDYLGIIIIFSTCFMVAYSLEVLVKTDGFPIYAIIFVTLAAFINIFLDYVFVIVYDYGVKGAAFATGLSQLISGIGFLVHFLIGRSNLKFTRFKFDFKQIGKMIYIGFPEALTELSAGFTTFAFNYVILRVLGYQGIAAFGVIMYINNLVLMTMIGINQGMQPLISFYNGQKNQANIKKLLKLSLQTALGFGLLFLIVSQIFSEQLVGLFITPDNLVPFNIALKGISLFSFGFLICGFNIIISGYFTALKFAGKAMTISFLRGYGLISLTLAILPQFLGDTGIWLAPAIYEILTLLVALPLYLNHREKQKMLISKVA